jgi:hypothetical protein
MKIQDLFLADVTRDIPPVVYFHEQSPEKLKAEVGEYIITGGYPDGDPRAKRLKAGIHEQFVHLLTNIAKELQKPSGPELPAAWISGFYGSGKSSFAKLLGLALDDKLLPDETLLADALLTRDDSPRREEFVQAWKALRARIEPISVVFDIGGIARDDEHIHVAALRQVQARLGYCSKSALVAAFELKMERDGTWNAFLAAAQKTLKKPWSKAKDEHVAEDHFSHVLHVLDPARYTDPMSWFEVRAGMKTGEGTATKEVVDAIDAMLSIRAPGKALFIVVDEVSQYVHQDDNRMLKLQSFVSELGTRLKGVVWLFATGQQKLEDTGQSDNIGKMKDRFPQQLRVHLHPSNIRDVVHKRLLAKKPGSEKLLRAEFQKHRADLTLHGYKCEAITEEDFLEVYPMLPGHVDLLMQITSNLRTRSTRVQGDDHAIRGLLQLLGELFREQKLGERNVGDLVTLDAIFEVQSSALEADVQTTLTRIFDHAEVRDDALALRAAKAVALLELLQPDGVATTPELVAKCLYQTLGEGNQVQAISKALEKLRNANLVGYSEKLGFKIQSSAGQEWEREREDIGVTAEQVSAVVREKIKQLLAAPERPRYKGSSFPWAAFYSDGKQVNDERVQGNNDNAAVTVDFRFLRKRDDRAQVTWIPRSEQELLKDRLVWVVGDPGPIESLASEFAKSEHMVKRHASRRESLTSEKGRLLLEEEARFESLDKKASAAVAEAFLDGRIYFRGRPLEPRTLGSTFAAAIGGAAVRILPDLYPYFTEIAVTDSEIGNLLDKQMNGPSTKFMEAGLGILTLDAGRYVATCAGAEPTRIFQFIDAAKGTSGASLISHFGGPPFGYPVDVVRACLAGLLRGGKIRIRPDGEPEITSINDPGTRDLFKKDRELRRADIFPAQEGAITARDKVKIRTFFKTHLDLDLDAENDPFADAVYAQFPVRRERLREIEARYAQLPGRPPLPGALDKLGRALEDCRRSRQVEETVLALKKNLPALGDGLEQLGIFRSELTDEALHAVAVAAEVQSVQLAQLQRVEAATELEKESALLAEQLQRERPWRNISSVSSAIAKIKEQYVEHRKTLLNKQNKDAEAARSRIKARTGFDGLTADQAYGVLKPFEVARFDTTAKAVAPALAEILTTFPGRLAAAEEKANDALDAILSDSSGGQVVKVPADLRGRELKTRDDLDRMLAELKDRLGPMLDKGSRIRLF